MAADHLDAAQHAVFQQHRAIDAFPIIRQDFLLKLVACRLADGVKFAKDPPYEVPKSGFLYGMGATADGREMLRMGIQGYADAGYEVE